MLRFLHQLTGFSFYVLGALYFLGYLLLRNDIHPGPIAVLMQVMDLPLIVSALLYGGMSLYLSVRKPESTSRALPWIIALPLIVLFSTLMVMNFWP
ncbi:MAG: hypothetical protein AAB489_06125 [Patescibacteria group bacterium]